MNAAAERGFYAYALVSSESTLDLTEIRGIGDAAVELVTHRDIGVVVSEVAYAALDVDEDDLSETSPVAALARRHDDVVRAVFAQVTTLPLRFGTVVRDREGARRLGERAREDAREVLGRLEGRREWGVRLRRAEPEAGTAAAEQERARSRSETTSGTAYLARRGAALKQQQADRTRERDLAAEVDGALSQYAAEVVRRSDRTSAGVLSDLAYLVEEANEAAFLREVDRLTAAVPRSAAQLDTTGPWPPYSFARIEVAADT